MNRWTATLLIAATLVACGPRQEAKNTLVSPTLPASQEAPTQATVEGVIDSGGGRGVICQKDEQKVLSLDLYEAREVHGLTINKQLKSEAEALEFVIDTLAEYFWMPEKNLTKEAHLKQVEELLMTKYKQIKFLETGKSLKLMDDSHDVVLDRDCNHVQVAIYYNENSLMIDGALWEKMSWTDRAALLMHEAIYFKARQIGARNSIETRRLVGTLFSEQGIAAKAEGMPEDLSKAQVCELKEGTNVSGLAYAYDTTQNGKAGVEMVFSKIGDIQSIFRLSSFFVGGKASDLEVKDSTFQGDLVKETFPVTMSIRLSVRKGNKRMLQEANLTQGKTGKIRRFEYDCKPLSVQTP